MLSPLRSHQEYLEFIEHHLAEIKVVPFHHVKACSASAA